MNKIDLEEQKQTPFLSALIDYVNSSPVPFDVPGHKLGSFQTDLFRLIDKPSFLFDANAPIGLDNLYNAKGVLKQAEVLASKLCHSSACFFSVNGTTGGILTMLVSCLYSKDKIILPRNVHKSIVNGLIISGTIPIFVNPDIDEDLGIACGVRSEDVIKAMDENPTAKAVFVINPTYFGIASDLKTIVKEAHKRNMIVICDEAHGSNFYFSDELPISAMDAGADITAMSMHKNSGSLTQTSMILLQGERVDYYEVKRAFGMFSSTSPNPILLASLDAARKEMALHGKEIIHADLQLASYAREKLNAIKGIHVYGREYLEKRNNSGTFDLDETKLVIDTRGLNLYGYEVYKEIRKQSNIQLELGEVSVVLAIISPGTTKEHVDRLIEAFALLSKRFYDKKKKADIPHYHYSFPQNLVSPRVAYDAPHKVVDLKESIGELSAETVMAYPPGIPLVIPGEIISLDAVKLIEFYQDEGGEVLKDTEQGKIKIIDRKNWYLSEDLPFPMK